MGLGRTLLLGAIAGSTIIIGLPIGRLRRPAPALRTFLNATAVGVLLFLVWDILSQAWEPVDAALGSLRDGGRAADVFGYGSLFFGGLAVGLLSLVAYEGRIHRSAAPRASAEEADPSASAASVTTIGPGSGVVSWSPARRLALMIAVGIGLHNFAEGLAIGQSAARGEIALATLLVIGFGLHNATEGFGITAPLAGDVASDGSPRRPSWTFLLTLGLIAGGPTFVGSVLGHAFTSEPMSVVFLSLAAGSIIYVIAQLLGIAARARRTALLANGLLLGLAAGFVTDAILIAAGA